MTPISASAPAALAARFYDSVSPALRPGAPAEGFGAAPEAASPGAAVAGAARSFAETLRAGEATALSGLAGKADAQSVVTALAASEIAVQTAVTLRDKVVEAYNEILRMPV